MNYEEAWKRLKIFSNHISELSFEIKKSEAKTDEQHLRAQCVGFMSELFFNEMERIEKEMTTALDDDGQKVQD